MTHLPTPSRRALLTGAAALAPLVAIGSGSAMAANYRATNGLRFIDGSPWDHTGDPNVRSVDFRFATDQVKVFNPSLRVTVPPSYLQGGDRRYPVLLLLHGGFGFFLDWTHLGNVYEQTEKHEVIVVMPDGGGGSFYSNANFPQVHIANFETYIMEQVLPFVHANFRTRQDAVGIAGLSMGGFGALALGHKYWGHFRTVSSYSGPSDTFDPLVRAVIWGGPVADGKRFGPAHTNLPGATWGTDDGLHHMYNPMDHLDRYRGKRLFLRAGEGVALDMERFSNLDEVPANFQESVVLETNRNFVAKARNAGLEVDFNTYANETHDFGNWSRALAEDLPGMMQVLNR